MKPFLTLALLFSTTCVSAQDYMDKIVAQTCECGKNINDTINQKQMFMEIGICMIKVAEPYKKQLKKDHNINLDNIDQEGEALGKLIGMKMASTCPEVLRKITEQADKKSAESGQEVFTGRVIKIEKDFFVIFTVNDESKTLKFYWLTNAESNIDLLNQYAELLTKEVMVKYKITSLFDPKINDYRNFNVIEKIEKLTK